MTLQNKKTIQMRTVDETHACTHAQRDKVNKMPTSTCISAKRNKVPTLLCKSKRRLIRVETRNTMSAASYFGCDCAVEAAAAADANANASPWGKDGRSGYVTSRLVWTCGCHFFSAIISWLEYRVPVNKHRDT